MCNRKIIYSILIMLALLAAILAMIFFSIQNSKMKVVFLDVGQGDAILVSSGPNQVLIDGGKDGKILLGKLGKYIPFWDRDIEAVVATHPDQDHIGGLISAVKTYRIGSIIKTNAQSDSQTFKKLEEEIILSEAQRVDAEKNVTIKFPNGEVAEILYPFKSLPHAVDNDSNANSVVMKLTSGSSSFLFTGDLPSAQEAVLVSDPFAFNSLNSQVLKVGHHGSKYSTSEEFLSAIKPTAAIISVGKNSYGHPNQEALQRLMQHKINILRTDELGDIIYDCINYSDRCVRVAN